MIYIIVMPVYPVGTVLWFVAVDVVLGLVFMCWSTVGTGPHVRFVLEQI
jgi:hypothetical protein